MRKKKLRQRLQHSFGVIPQVHYEAGDLERIRAYYDFRREQEPEEFLLDDITWNDLDMDGMFLRLNPGLSFSGEQYLYYLLRAPAQSKEEYERRRRLIGLMGREGDLRLRVQMLLHRLGCRRKAALCRAFAPENHSPLWLVIYLLLVMLLVAAVVYAAVDFQAGAALLILACALNGTIHEVRIRQVQGDFDTVNYTVAMVFALRRLRKMKHAGLDEELQEAYAALDDLRAVVRTGGISRAADDGISALVMMVTLADLIAYEFLRNKLGKCHKQVFTIHEVLGRLDAAIAVASWRESMEVWCHPQLDFVAAEPYFAAEGLGHPLLADAVGNDLTATRPVLITGSNASGKSTFLKATALTACLSQSLCTAPAQRYEATAFRIYSSMALSDDLLAGESYYIVETRSLKRILDETDRPGQPVLCLVDEVLRGTNTVERIAASSEVLSTLAAKGTLCLAATHDLELCELLGGAYDLYHFREYIEDDEMWFDYRLQPGKATSRNAINLLRLLGFDGQLVKNAHARADRYVETGIWE